MTKQSLNTLNTMIDGGSVRFGNNEPCSIKGRGRISLTKELVCDNAYWVE